MADEDMQSPQGPGPYPAQGMQPPPQPMVTQVAMNAFQQPTTMADAGNGAISGMNTFFDPYDPMLDADPFGLTASMHFPTQFSYDAR
jgi:hypothetical protein